MRAGRPGDARQDQHGRVRDGIVHGVLRLRPDEQPVGPRAGSRAAPAAARPRPSAAYEAPLAIGTDTGGSIRQPGAVTGTVGAKPTYGGTSRYGLVAFSSSLDTPGPCARTVEDAALLHAVIAGHDPRDSTSIPQPVPDVVGAARLGATGDLSGVRLGLVTRVRGRGRRAGCRGGLPRGGRGAGQAGRRGRRGLLPALRVRAAGVLPDRAERVLVEPGPLRRCPVMGSGSATTGERRWRRSCR